MPVQPANDPYAKTKERYRKFLEVVHDPDATPIRVFDPLTEKQLQELYLIREVSKDLQKKKEEEMRKAASKEEEDAKLAAEKKETEEVPEEAK